MQAQPPPPQTHPITTSGHQKSSETQPQKQTHSPPFTPLPAQTPASYLQPNPQPSTATTHPTNDRHELRRRREPREQLEPKNNRRGAGDSILTNDLGSQILSTSIRRISKPPPCRPPPPPTFHGQSPAEKTRRAVKHPTPVQQRKTWWDPFYLDTSGRRRILAVRNFFTSAPLLLLLRSHCRISSTSPSLLQLRSLPLPLRLHCSSASKMPSYSSRTPLLLLRFITVASAACRRCRSTSSLLLLLRIIFATCRRYSSATSPLPLCLHCLSFSKRLPSEPLHPTHHRTTSDGKPSPLGIAGATHQWPPAAFTTPLPTTTLPPLHPDTDR